MSGESTATLCLFAWCQAEREAEFFVDGWGDCSGTDNGASALVEASERAFRRWDARLTLSVCGNQAQIRAQRSSTGHFTGWRRK